MAAETEDVVVSEPQSEGATAQAGIEVCKAMQALHYSLCRAQPARSATSHVFFFCHFVDYVQKSLVLARRTISSAGSTPRSRSTQPRSSSTTVAPSIHLSWFLHIESILSGHRI